jgi:membrane fusion protein (multidrug efflux system)
MAAVVVVVLIVVGGIFWLRARGRESTDDAQVDGRITQIAPRVGGTVINVAVDNNLKVAAGAVLVQIDPRDYEVAVARAKAELADAGGDRRGRPDGVPIGAHRKARGQAGVGRRAAGGRDRHEGPRTKCRRRR